MMAEGGWVSVSSLSVTYGNVLSHEPQPYVPYNPIHEKDIEKLLSIESERTDNWTQVKKNNEIEVWRRKLEEQGDLPVTKAVLSLDGISYKRAVSLITNWKIRREWDKTFDIVDVLERIGNFKVMYKILKTPWFCNKRDLVLAQLGRSDPDQHCYILAWKSTDHPSVPAPPKSNLIRAEALLSGTIIRPVGEGAQSSRVTVITQMNLRGSAPQGLCNSYLAGNPVKWLQMLKKYHLAHKDDKLPLASQSEMELKKSQDTLQKSKERLRSANSIDNAVD